MKHLNEEELILHFYGEGRDRPAVDALELLHEENQDPGFESLRFLP